MDPAKRKKPGFINNSLELLVVLAVYPLIGSALLFLMTGGKAVGPDFQWLDDTMISRFRVVQAAGQIIVLGLPVFWMVRRYSGEKTAFSSANLAWLGIGTRAGFREILFAAAGMILLQPLLFTIVEMQNFLWPLLGETGQQIIRDHERLDLFLQRIALSRSIPEFIAVVGVLAITPACCEELFFRGYIQKNYSYSLSAPGAVLLTGFVFALFHMDISNLLPLSLLGWYIGYIYMKTNNLAVPAVAHGLNNVAALLFLQRGDILAGEGGETGNAVLVLTWPWWIFLLATLGMFITMIVRFSRASGSVSRDNDGGTP
jgi:membrane protease YdiL (CAAX protease family)